MFGGAILVPYQGGILPIVCGGIPRRLASKVAVCPVVYTLTSYSRPLQVGVGVSRGIEADVLAVNRVARKHAPEEGHLSALEVLKTAI